MWQDGPKSQQGKKEGQNDLGELFNGESSSNEDEEGVEVQEISILDVIDVQWTNFLLVPLRGPCHFLARSTYSRVEIVQREFGLCIEMAGYVSGFIEEHGTRRSNQRFLRKCRSGGIPPPHHDTQPCSHLNNSLWIK